MSKLKTLIFVESKIILIIVILLHFQLEEVTDNCIHYQIMSEQQGVPVILSLRKGVLTKKFQCQKETKAISVRKVVLKRHRLRLLPNTLTEATARKSVAKNVAHTKHLTNLNHLSIDFRARYSKVVSSIEYLEI